jgi:uncharacterized protein (TIGR02453 family)
MAWFTPEFFSFFEDLAEHNERAWFEASRPRYETHVKQACVRFVEAVRPGLQAISPALRADARSIFRIHRDVRFSKDKSPYKTNAGLHFRHERASDAHTPGFYLHLSPEGCWFGCGLWRPDPPTLRRLRDRIVADPAGWEQVKAQIAASGLSWGGDRLTRVPKGFDPAHPLAADLMWKDFTLDSPLSFEQVFADDLVERYIARCADGAPLVADLARTLDLSW